MTVVSFEDPHCREVELSGGKGASLARMAELGFRVPPGFVVDTAALEICLEGRSPELLELMRGADPDDLGEAARRAQEVIAAIEIPPDLRAQIAAAYAEIGDEAAVAVRSSARAEDSDTASFAGQQETYLHVRGIDRVVGRIRDCWASFFTERALFYRRQKGSLEDLGMAVVVQRMIDSEVSGVMFTCDPARRRRDRIVVEAVFGLGEALVSGQVTPDHYVLKRDGAVKRRRLQTQPFALVSAPDGGTRERALSEQEGATATLDDGLLRDLAEIGGALEDQLGGAQDVEWACADGRIYVLQSRPVTA